MASGRGSQPAGFGWDERTEELLRTWHARCTAAQHAHYQRVTELRRRNLMLGVPVVVLSSAVGTSLFATLTRSEVNKVLRVVVGAISVLAAILAALQTFLRFGERAEKHSIAGDWYAAVRRDLEAVLALPRESREPAKVYIDKVRKELSKVGQQSPEIGERLWAQMARQFGIEEKVDLTQLSPGSREGELQPHG